jgi:hypothetical protein
MSHVEPRSNYALGSGSLQGVDSRLTGTGGMFSGQTVKPTPNTTSRYLSKLLTNYPKLGALGIYGAAAGVGTGLGALTDFYARGTKTPEEYRRLQEMSEFGIMDETSLDSGKAMKYIEEGGKIGVAPGLFPRGGRKTFYEERGLDPETGLPLPKKEDIAFEVSGEIAQRQPGESAMDAVARQAAQRAALRSSETKTAPGTKDEPKYQETDIKKEVIKESEMLRDLLKDENYSKGELALIISGALKKEGSISDKIAEAARLGLPLARKRKEDDRAITLAAYKLAKEKEQQEIKASTQPKELKLLYASAKATAERTGGDVNKIYKQKLEDFSGLDSVTQKAVNSLLSERGIGEVTKLVNSLKDARQRRADAVASNKDTKKIDKEISELTNEFDTLRKIKGFEIAYPEYVNFQNGGRVMKAVGGEVEEDIIASDVSFGNPSQQDATVVEKPVEKLSYRELRDRLPQEITDDVVQLLSNSEEALQDFAYIRTQDDVNGFNVKYGVNLIIPPQQG